MYNAITALNYVCMSDFYCSSVSRDSLNQPASNHWTGKWTEIVEWTMDLWVPLYLILQ